jgi:hypothetical protein
MTRAGVGIENEIRKVNLVHEKVDVEGKDAH